MSNNDRNRNPKIYKNEKLSKKERQRTQKINEPIAKNGICTDDSYDAYQLLADGQNLTHLMMANLCNNSHKWSPTQILSMKQPGISIFHSIPRII